MEESGETKKRQKAEYDEKSNPNVIQRTLDTAYMERAENIPLDEQKVRAFVVKPQLKKRVKN